MTVINNDGLVGRVLRVTRTTATVLLIIDTESIVGGRVGSSLEIGFVHGTRLAGRRRARAAAGRRRASSRPSTTPSSPGAAPRAPYQRGVPVGRVTDVYTSLIES